MLRGEDGVEGILVFGYLGGVGYYVFVQGVEVVV